VSYLFAAQNAAAQRDHACQAVRVTGRAAVSQGSPSPSLLAILGVLRRPARPTDRLPTHMIGRDHRVIPNGSLPPAKEI
jgi:hypothetical protein